MTDGLWIEVASAAGSAVVAVLGSWFTMRAQVSQAHRDAQAATRAAREAHAKLEALDRRVTIVERDQAHHGRQLESALARIEGAIVALHARLDRALANGNGPGGREE